MAASTASASTAATMAGGGGRAEELEMGTNRTGSSTGASRTTVSVVTDTEPSPWITYVAPFISSQVSRTSPGSMRATWLGVRSVSATQRPSTNVAGTVRSRWPLGLNTRTSIEATWPSVAHGRNVHVRQMSV